MFLLLFALRRLYINMLMAIHDINAITLPIIAPSTLGVSNLCTSSLLNPDVVPELTGTRKKIEVNLILDCILKKSMVSIEMI